MAITVKQKTLGVSGTVGENATLDVEFLVFGTTDKSAAAAALLLVADATFPGLNRKSPRGGIEQIGDDIWLGTVNYVEDDEEDDAGTFSFDTGGGTTHVTQSIKNIKNYAPPGDAVPDFKGAVNVQEDGTVEGLDVPIPALAFQFTKKFDPALVTEEYEKTLARMSRTTNDAAFRGYAAGEVMFISASGSLVSEDDFPITFKFSASENITDFRAGDITGIDKKGWEYLWFRYQTVEDAAAKMLVKKPISAHVEQMFRETDFTDLGL